MNHISRNLFRAGLIALSLASASALAQDFPIKPITMVVPLGPGGAVDIGARLVAEKMSTFLGRAVIVENKAGGASVVGATYVARAPNDGYTLLVAVASTYMTIPFLVKDLPYNTLEFEPVAMISQVPVLLIAANHVPAKDLKEFVAWAKSRPQGFTAGQAGSGSSTHVMAVRLAKQLGINMVNVGYRSSPAANADLLAGNIDVQFDAITGAKTLQATGKTRLIAIFGDKRSAALPNVPSSAEQGFPEAISYSWLTLVAPPKTPKPVAEKLNATVNRILAQPDVKQKFAEMGQQEYPLSLDETGKFLRDQYKLWGDVIRTENIRAD